LVGTFEISRGLMVREALTDAARKACRLGILSTAANSALQSDISTTLSDNGLTYGDATVTILVNGAGIDVSTAERYDKISVQISIPSSKVYWTSNVILGGRDIQSQPMVMMRQQ